MNPPYPKRIASLLASGTEILYGLGLGERVVAVSHECDFPEEVRNKPRVTSAKVRSDATSRRIDEQVREMSEKGTPLYEIDVKRLAGLRPDLIVTQSQCDVCAVRYEDVVRVVAEEEGLRGARIVSLNPMTFEGIFDDILRVGEAARCAERAGQTVASLRERVELVRSKTRHLSEQARPRVLCIEWTDPVMVSGNWMPELIEIAGGRCDLVGAGEHSALCDWDSVVAFAPEVIVVMPCGFELERTLSEMRVLAALPEWDALPAVCAGRVHAADGNAYFNRSGPRMIESLEILAGIVHPELFAAARPEAARRTTPERGS